jgi:hypothetical protein
MDSNRLQDSLRSAGAWLYAYHDYIFIGLGVLVVLVVWSPLKRRQACLVAETKSGVRQRAGEPRRHRCADNPKRCDEDLKHGHEIVSERRTRSHTRLAACRTHSRGARSAY